MKPHLSLFRRLLMVSLTGLLAVAGNAQEGAYAFKPPVININFGSGQVADINDAQPPNYSLVWDRCPNDGYYTFTPATSDCFFGDWFTLTEDHTPGDAGGNMMLVNATPLGGLFFHRVLEGLKGGANYQFMAFLMNVCRIRGGCPPLPPDIVVKLTTPSGKVVSQFRTGQLVQTASPHWTGYTRLFTMPPGESSVVLTMTNTTTGGCGNDFALDDITIREYEVPEPPVVALARLASQAISEQVALKKLPIKEEPPKTERPKEERPKEPPLKPTQRAVQVALPQPESKVPEVTPSRPITSRPVPAVLLTRENPLVKEIETTAGEIKIDLYDNGVVDGDTVSVYHNNELIVSAAPLSQRPITFRIRVDAQQPRHELIMVAHNLGSIPPNTSLMIVTAGDKRYEAFISSSEQKNAKVVISLQKE